MKNVKVFEIVSRLQNGHDRTVNAVVPLDAELSDICKGKQIPMLSITSVKVIAPMELKAAVNYVFYKQVALVLNPNTVWFKTTMSIEENVA